MDEETQQSSWEVWDIGDSLAQQYNRPCYRYVEGLPAAGLDAPAPGDGLVMVYTGLRWMVMYLPGANAEFAIPFWGWQVSYVFCLYLSLGEGPNAVSFEIYNFHAFW